MPAYGSHKYGLKARDNRQKARFSEPKPRKRKEKQEQRRYNQVGLVRAWHPADEEVLDDHGSAYKPNSTAHLPVQHALPAFDLRQEQAVSVIYELRRSSSAKAIRAHLNDACP